MSRKQEIVTFKVDAELGEVMRRIPNRSRFIRSAILAALGGICPLCNGSGVLTPAQQRHWEAFAENHAVERCAECGSRFLVCSKS